MNRPMTRRSGLAELISALLFSAALLAIAACGSTGAVGTSGSGSSSGGPVAAVAVEAKARLDKLAEPASGSGDFGTPVDTSQLVGKTIVYVPIVGKVGYFDLVAQNLQQAVEKVGAKLTICDGDANPSKIAACLDQVVAQKPAAVVVDYIPYGLGKTGFEAVRAASIPLLIYGADAPAGVPTSPQFAFASPDYYEYGAIDGAVDAVIADSNGEAHVLYLQVTDSDTVTNAGLHAVAHFKSACPACVVTVKTANNATMGNLPSLVSSALTADPSITYVVPQVDSYLTAATTGIQSAGKARDVKLATSNGIYASIQQVQTNPQLIALVGNNPPYIAWTMADSIFRMIQGQAPPKQYPVLNRAFTKQNVGTLELTPETANSGALFGSTAYKDLLTRLWGR